MTKIIGKGHLDVVSNQVISGWALFENDSDVTPEIVIKLDGKEFCRTRADKFREDVLKNNNHTNGNCGFEISDFDKLAIKKGVVIRAFIAETNFELANSPFAFNSKMSDLDRQDFAPIIFIHIPKTGGTSFRRAALKYFGDDSILQDYGENSEHTSEVLTDGVYSENKLKLANEVVSQRIKFITGHFKVRDYLQIFDTGVHWCFFIRSPVQRIISEYKHMVKFNGYTDSFETFYKQPERQNLQYKALQGLQLEDVFFIGLTEEYSKSLKLFNKQTGYAFPYFQHNLGEGKINETYQLDDEVEERILKLNEKDVALYHHAKTLFEQKCDYYHIRRGYILTRIIQSGLRILKLKQPR